MFTSLWSTRSFCALLQVLLLALSLSSFNARAADSLTTVKTKKELRVGLDPGFIPFEMKNPKGEMIGFDIDMIQGFASSLGAKATFVDTRWEGIIPALIAKKFDLIVSGMTITEERKRRCCSPTLIIAPACWRWFRQNAKTQLNPQLISTKVV